MQIYFVKNAFIVRVVQHDRILQLCWIQFVCFFLTDDECGCVGDLVDDLVSVLFDGFVSGLDAVAGGVGHGSDGSGGVGNGSDVLGAVSQRSNVSGAVSQGGNVSGAVSQGRHVVGSVGQSTHTGVTDTVVRMVTGSRVTQRSVGVGTAVAQNGVVGLTGSDSHQGSENNLNHNITMNSLVRDIANANASERAVVGCKSPILLLVNEIKNRENWKLNARRFTMAEFMLIG